MRRIIPTLFIVSLLLFASCRTDSNISKPAANMELTAQQSNTQALLIGVSAANPNVVWTSGTNGTILRTVDGGNTWKPRPIPATDSLQFRDVYAVSADTAYVLSIGKGDKSRIYKTVDGGSSWTLQFKSNIAEAFFDCMAFWNPKTGIAFSDAVNGEFIIIKTTDGGKNWNRIPPEQLPSAQPGAGSFAASGTCVATKGDSTAWIGTGNAGQPYVLRTTNRGQTWEAFPIPLDAGSGAGAASIIFRDLQHGLVLGGDIPKPATSDSSAAITTDGGSTWKLVKTPPLNSPVYGSDYIPNTQSVVAVGPGGIAVSPNEGNSWQQLDTTDTWGVTFANAKNGWAVGPNGRIIHITVH